MLRYRLSFVLVALVAFTGRLGAQSVTSHIVTNAGAAVDVNFTEIANYEKSHPPAKAKKLPFDEGEEREVMPARPLADPATIRMYTGVVGGTNGAADGSTPHTAYLSVTPPPADTFQAKASNGTAIPPDTHGAVDSTYAVTAINTSITIQNRTTHAVVSTVSLDGFWSSMETTASGGHGTGAYDPRVHYDPNYKRWIMMADVYGETTYSQLFIAVSATSSPTGTWHMYRIVVGGSNWLDFPCVGFNNRWIAISGNMFTSAGAFVNDVLYVLDYATMMSGGTLSYGTINPSSSVSQFTICPAQTFDAAEHNLFCIENWNGGSGQVRLTKITGNIGGLTLSTVATPSTSTHWKSAPNTTSADFVPQLGTTDMLQANDDRINNFSQRNNKFWFAYTAFLPATGTVNRAAAMWWQIDSTGTANQVGLIDAGSATDFYFFPSISSNQNNDALIGFAHSSSSIHPSCSYVVHANTDAAGTTTPVYTYRHGQKTYYQDFGSGEDRWGDYSATCTDPRNNLDFWTLQESVPNYSGAITNSIWDTWWAYVRVCGTVGPPTPAITSSTQCQGSSAWYSINPVAGATGGNTWNVSGTGWTFTTSTTTDSIYLTAGASAGTAVVSVSAIDSCGAGTAYTFTVTPLPIPSEVIFPVDTICAGMASATFSLTATGSPLSYSWTVLGTGWSILGSSVGSSILAGVGSGVGTIIVNATNSCGTGPNDTLVVTPNSGPGAATTITSTSTVYCSGSTVTFTTPAVSGATSYIWTVSGTGWSGSSTTNSINVTVGTGVATITVTPVNSCGNGTSFTLNSIVPTTSPTATFSESTHVTFTHTNVTCTFTGIAPFGTTYTWDFSGGVATPGTGFAGPQTVHWNTAGLYTVTLTVDNGGCSATYSDTVRVNPSVGVQQVSVPTFDANIVPNPNDGSFDITFDQAVTKPVSVKISDMLGRSVYYREFGTVNNDKISVETDHLPVGNYNATIYIDGAFVTKKLTIGK